LGAVAFLPNGRALVTRTSIGECYVWKLTGDGGPQRLPTPQAQKYTFATVSPDGKIVVVSKERSAACLLETATGKEIGEVAGARSDEAAFSADGKTVALRATRRDQVILYKVGDGTELRRWPEGAGTRVDARGRPVPPRRGEQIDGVALSPDAKVAAAAFAGTRNLEGLVRFWDTATGKELRSLGWSGASFGGMAFSPDGRVLALAGGKSGLRVWDVATGRELWDHRPSHRNAPSGFAFSPDGKWLATGHAGLVRLWDVATGRELLPAPEQRARIGFVRLSSDGRTVMTAPGAAGEDDPGERATIFRYWDARTGMELAAPSGRGQKLPPFDYLGLDVDLSADGKTFAAPGTDRAVHLWDVATGKELHKIAHEGQGCCQFSPDGKLLLLQRFDPKAPADSACKGALWDVATGKPLGEVVTGSCTHSFSPDGKVLASSWDPDNSVRLLDTGTRRDLRRLGHPGRRSGVCTFSPDGKTLAWVGGDRPEIRLWDVATGAEKATLVAGQPKGTRWWNVERLVFTPDGKWLVGGGIGGTVCIWDAATGALRRGVATGHSFLTQLAVSADGHVLLTADYETGLVWDVPELLKGNDP
jgi:WD40 repeat protein